MGAVRIVRIKRRIMKKHREILIVSLLVAGLAALLALSPGSAVQAASSDIIYSSSSSSSTDCNFALSQLASGDWREAVEFFGKTLADDAKNAEVYIEAYAHDKRRMDEDEDDEDEDDG